MTKDVALQLQSGQIIETTAATMPLLRHYGIVVNDGGAITVLHNTPKQSTTRSPLEDFLKGRSIIAIHGSPLENEKQEVILQRFESIAEMKYDLFGYNCEHFIERMTGVERITQLQIFTTLAVIVLLWRVISKPSKM